MALIIRSTAMSCYDEDCDRTLHPIRSYHINYYSCGRHNTLQNSCLRNSWAISNDYPSILLHLRQCPCRKDGSGLELGKIGEREVEGRSSVQSKCFEFMISPIHDTCIYIIECVSIQTIFTD